MQRIFLNVGYELSEKQLRGHFITFGVLSDLYLPKHTNGRNKGYGFATFATEQSLTLALQQPKHIINGVTVQVSYSCRDLTAACLVAVRLVEFAQLCWAIYCFLKVLCLPAGEACWATSP